MARSVGFSVLVYLASGQSASLPVPCLFEKAPASPPRKQHPETLTQAGFQEPRLDTLSGEIQTQAFKSSLPGAPQLVKHETLDLGAVSLSPTLGGEPT